MRRWLCAPVVLGSLLLLPGCGKGAAGSSGPGHVEIEIKAPRPHKAQFDVSGGVASRLSDNMMIQLFGDCPAWGPGTLNAVGGPDWVKIKAQCPGWKVANIYVYEEKGQIKPGSYSGLKPGTKKFQATVGYDEASGANLAYDTSVEGKGVTITRVTDSEVEGTLEFESKLGGSTMKGRFKVPIRKAP